MTNEASASSPSSLARWKVLLGAIVVQLILGTVYGYSIFWQPLEEKLYPKDFVSQSEQSRLVDAGTPPAANIEVLSDKDAKKRHDERQAPLKYAFALAILTFAVTMVYAGRVQDARGPRFPALIGAVLLGGGFVLASLVLRAGLSGIQANVIALCLTLGVLAGAGIGFAYVCPIAALVKWFPTAKGLVSGIAVAGFGFGAFIFSDTKYLPFGGGSYLKENGPTTFFLVHGFVALIAVAIGALMLSNPPGTLPKAAVESGWRELLRKPPFYLLWAMFFSGALAGLTVIGVAKGFAGEQLVAAAGAVPDDVKKQLMERGAAAVGMLAIFNAVGRVLWGTVSDLAGRTPAFVGMFVFQAIMMFVLPQLSSETAITLGAGMVGFNFGGNFALFPSATADLFGAKNMGANYGLVFTSYGAAGVVGIYAANMAKDVTGSYGAAFALCGVLCVVSAALAVALHVWRAKNVPAAA